MTRYTWVQCKYPTAKWCCLDLLAITMLTSTAVLYFVLGCVVICINELVLMNRMHAKLAILILWYWMILQAYYDLILQFYYKCDWHLHPNIKHSPQEHYQYIINMDKLHCPFHISSPWNLYNPPKWSKRVSKDLETGSSSRKRWMTMSKTGRKRKHTLPK